MTSAVTRVAHPVSDLEPVAVNAESPVSATVPAMSDTAPAVPPDSAAADIASRAAIDANIVCAIVAEAAGEITGVCSEVQVRAVLARGSAELRMRVPVRYPMPIWRVTTACRAHVLERMRERCGIAVRRLDIEVSELTEPAR